MGALLELADAFLADPQVQADLAERLLGDAADPVVVRDDPPLALVQPAEEPIDRRSAPVPGLIPLVALALGVGRPRASPGTAPRTVCGGGVPSVRIASTR